MVFVLVEYQISQKCSSLILDVCKKKVDELGVRHTFVLWERRSGETGLAGLYQSPRQLFYCSPEGE